MGAAAIPAVLGVAGLVQANNAQKAQNKANSGALKIAKNESQGKLEIQAILKALADQYNPGKETDAAVGYAGDVASQSLGRALGAVKGQYGPSGTGDSEFHVSGQRAVNDALDPLKAFAADRKSKETLSKAQLYALAAGTPVGNLSDSYFKYASTMPPANFGGPTAMLSQAFNQLLAQKPRDNSLAAQGGSDTSSGGGTQNIDWSFLGNIR